MRWNHWIRQGHRGLSIAFTLTVVANFAARARGEPPAWLTYSPLPPLFLLLFSGLYMFVLPHATRWRDRRHRADGHHTVQTMMIPAPTIPVSASRNRPSAMLTSVGAIRRRFVLSAKKMK